MEDRLRLQVATELSSQADIPTIDVLKDCLPYRLSFIQDQSKRKAVCSTRRSAKTYASCIYQIDTAIKTPNAKIAYLTLTNESAKRIVWRSIIQPICLKYQIEAELYTSKNEIRFCNGSTIFLIGLDATPKQMNRLRGNAFDLVILDECQNFTQDLKEIYQGVLKMTLAQTGATLVMLGTPGNSLGTHYWWLINKPSSQETEWKRFFFDWQDNTSVDPKSNLRVCDAIQQEIDQDIIRNPDIILTPEYQREILGLWVIETSARIYRYEPNINDIQTLPSPVFLKDATYALGFDLGYHPDPTALVIGCWNTSHLGDGYLYIINAEIHSKMITANLAARIKELDRQYNFSYIVGDSANLNVVEDMRQTYGLPCIRAEKQGKLSHQNMLNSDFITNHIRLYQPETQLLSKQLQEVIWSQKDLRLGKHVEDPKYHNDLTDCCLYLHHFSRHHWYQPPIKKLPLTNQQHYLQLTKQLIEQNIDNDYFIDWSEPNA